MLAALSLMLPYLFGLGSFIFVADRRLRKEMTSYSDSERLQLVAAILIFGVLVNYAIVLLLDDLKASLIAGCVVSITGLVNVKLSFAEKSPRPIEKRWLAILLVLYVCGLSFVVVEPLDGWDARSIWFFHGKMIFYNASVSAGGDWRLPTIGFSHTDYPELVPILAAQVALVAGYWNEYLPKAALVALLLPALVGLIAALRGRWWHLLFLSVPLFFTLEWIKNGYMDGYLALYAGLATFYFGSWLDREKILDLTCGVLCTGVTLGLKNEGMMFGVIIATALPVFLFLKKRGNWLTRDLLFENLPVLLVATSGYLLWQREKRVFQLKNDLVLGIHSLVKARERLSDGSLYKILRYLYVVDNVNLSFGIFLLCVVGAFWTRRRPTYAASFCSITALWYFSGIVLIYLATPFDLFGFHLPTGNRTMLPVHLLLLSAAFSLCHCQPED